MESLIEKDCQIAKDPMAAQNENHQDHSLIASNSSWSAIKLIGSRARTVLRHETGIMEDGRRITR